MCVLTVAPGVVLARRSVLQLRVRIGRYGRVNGSKHALPSDRGWALQGYGLAHGGHSRTAERCAAVHLDPAAALEGYARHRRRFAEEVATLDLAALEARSRCSEWSVADVLRHINDVDGWMDAIWSGRPPPFTAFDPNVTPRQWVEAGRRYRTRRSVIAS
jgi:hypothetical protein